MLSEGNIPLFYADPESFPKKTLFKLITEPEREKITMSRKLTVHMDKKPIYDIIITEGYDELSQVFTDLEVTGRKICIVTDSNVGPLYAGEVAGITGDYASFVTTFTFPAGEESKNLDTVSELYKHLIENQFDRNDILFALGGGVVGDLTGYAAATYLRGIRFVQLPTSLLAMVDSSIGGKTGVDFKAYKNMIGAFKQPKAVYMNLQVLSTLPERIYLSGFGEIIKHGMIQSAPYYREISDQAQQLCNRDLSAMEEIIYKSCEIKRAVVEEDPTEKGIRALLNFGHTLGHAIEKCLDFSLYHGECVALGYVCAAYISCQRGYITREELAGIEQITRALDLPIRQTNLPVEDILAATRNDKKMDGNTVKFILLHAIGDAYIDKTVTMDEMKDALHYLETI